MSDYAETGNQAGQAKSSSFDMEARRVIEALRSGVPSRAVGKYFSESRPNIMREVQNRLDEVCGNGEAGGNVRISGDSDRFSTGMVITGRYGEGKTHLLNTVFSMAGDENMVVSYVSLSKETPFDKLYLVYQKLMANTFLPGHEQPGFLHILSNVTPNSPVANDMLLYASNELQTNKLFYVLKSLLNTEDQDEKFQLQADLEGDFIANAALRKIYRRIFNAPAKFNVSFSKTKHMQDYLAFMSHLFRALHYNGWVILVDEAELVGRLGKKARLNAYRNMYRFLVPEKDPMTGKAWGIPGNTMVHTGNETLTFSHGLESTFSLFAFSSSYEEDVIDGKHDRENLADLFADDPAGQNVISTVITMITKGTQLQPLTHEEILQTLERMEEFHGKAYNWNPQVPAETLLKAVQGSGYLLRTRLRAAIEILDQLYQYGEAGGIRVDELGKESYEEDETPVVPELGS